MPFQILSEEDRLALLGVPTKEVVADLMESLEAIEATIKFQEGGSCTISAGSLEIEADSFSAAAKAMLGALELIAAVAPRWPEEADDLVLDPPRERFA